MSILEEAKRLSLKGEVIKTITERTKKYHQYRLDPTLDPFEILYINTLTSKGISNYTLAETYLYINDPNMRIKNRSMHYHKLMGRPEHVLMRYRHGYVKVRLPHNCDYNGGYQSRHMISQHKP